MNQADPLQRAWLEIKPAAIEHNARIIRNFISENCLLMAVVKADGYGHGAHAVAIAALKGGASCLGVATLYEGIELRKQGVGCPILILGNLINYQDLNTSFDWDLIPTISGLREAHFCEEIGIRLGRIFSIHIKIDTGMSRLGCDIKNTKNLMNQVNKLKHVKVIGIYSHLACADDLQNEYSREFTQKQKSDFEEIRDLLPSKYKNVCLHLSNSAGTLNNKDLHYDMVRIGLALYGYQPNKGICTQLELKPAMTVKARITFIREVSSGVGVSYGHLYKTNRKTRLAVVGIGYADGVNRALSGKISALINGCKLPQVGAITMDQLILDATDIPDLHIGSVVTLLGADGANSISVNDWTSKCDSIPWEILCGFKHRLPRVIV